MANFSLSQTEALGQSEVFLEFQERLSRVAPVDRPVLLLGERGTGKELAAERLHFLSRRWEGPFVTLNCNTLSPTLIESELFGHERGAFTGAENRRIGRFERAHGGTLFLDEIGAVPLEVQEKILRVVEYCSFERVGGSRLIEVDVRIVCATNADVAAMAERGEFKEDLLDRLSFEVLFLPPLRIRGEDILLLAYHFGARMAYELGREAPIRFTQKAMSALKNYQWPGNVRELKNVIERAVYSSESALIATITFDPFQAPFAPLLKEPPAADRRSGQSFPPVPDISEGFKEAVKRYEVALIRQALRQSRYHQKETAALLQLSYDQLRGLLRKYRSDLDRL